MHALFETMSLDGASFIEAIAVIITVLGAFQAAASVARIFFRQPTHGARKDIWRNFGTWLLLALEFELAADIIRSVVAPSWQEIGELGGDRRHPHVSQLLPRA